MRRTQRRHSPQRYYLCDKLRQHKTPRNSLLKGVLRGFMKKPQHNVSYALNLPPHARRILCAAGARSRARWNKNLVQPGGAAAAQDSCKPGHPGRAQERSSVREGELLAPACTSVLYEYRHRTRIHWRTAFTAHNSPVAHSQINTQDPPGERLGDLPWRHQHISPRNSVGLGSGLNSCPNFFKIHSAKFCIRNAARPVFRYFSIMRF